MITSKTLPIRGSLRNLSLLLAVVLSSIISSDAESAFTKGADPL